MTESFVRVATGGGARYARRTTTGYVLLDAPSWLDGKERGECLPPDTRLLSPCQPTKIVCVGLNYALHVAESWSRDRLPQEPILFLKPVSALLDPRAAILLPAHVGRVDHEAEVALVIGRRLHGATVEEARAAIFGVTALNDVTARELQKRDGQWTRAKGFDTFCPLGPCLVRGLDPDNLALSSRVNGETRQQGHTRDFLFASAELVAFISRVMTLDPGDVISTGTPAGVGPLVDGDEVEIEVEGVGVLRNPVRG